MKYGELRIQKIPIMIIGSKKDLVDQREVSTFQLEKYLIVLKKKFPKIKFINGIVTSALNEEMIEEAFETIIDDIIRYVEDVS